MDGATMMLAVAALAVNFGWQPSPDDPNAYEVLVQVEPELLDARASGESLRIESHVPVEIAPIRNVRVVVGKQELPRTPLAGARGVPERVVRGQESRPLEHSTNFQNNGWGDSRYQYDTPAATENSRRFEQRGATIGDDSLRTAEVPTPLARTQNAVVETGSALRDGIEAGIQQAGQQLDRAGKQVLNETSAVGRELDQEVQSLSTSVSEQARSVWPAPPPAQAATAPGGSVTPIGTDSSSGWTSIRSELAPPRLLNPQLVASNPSGATNSTNPWNTANGPSFPPGDSRAQVHSVLTDPSTSASSSSTAIGATGEGTVSQPNWSAGWGNTTTTASGNGLPTSQPQIPSIGSNSAGGSSASNDARWAWPETNSTSSAPTVTNPTNAATDNRYGQPATPLNTSATGTTAGTVNNDPWVKFGTPANGSGNVASGRYTTPLSSPPGISSAPSNQSQAVQAGGNPNVIGYANAGNPGSQPTTAEDELPWLPLLVVSVTLAASLGANLFLGWSYADARHRYRALVRKTTDTFQRAAGVAA